MRSGFALWSPERDKSLCLAILLGLSVVFLVLGLIDVPNSFYVGEDAFVYMGSAEIVCQGKTPYVDFAMAHPPGLLMLAVPLRRLGLGMVGQGYVFFAIGLALAGLVGWLTSRLGARGALAVSFGVLATLSSRLLFEHQAQVMSDLPAAVILTLSAVALLSEGWGALGVSAILLVAAAFFRLQCLTALPGLLLINWAIRGARLGTIRNIVLVALVLVLHSAVTMAIEARFPGYLKIAYGFQLSRPAISVGKRVMVINEILDYPEILLGLLAAIWLSFAKDRRVRGLALFGLATFLGAAIPGKSLYSHYFLSVLPSILVCISLLVGPGLVSGRRRLPIMICILLVMAMQLYDAVNRVRLGRTLHAKYSPIVARVRAIPEKVLLANPLYVVLGEKTFVDDYFAPDYLMPLINQRFDEWLRTSVGKADALLIDKAFFGDRASPQTVRAVRDSGKPVYFATDEDRVSWERRTSQLALTPTK
ncbi:MAG: hypothetical protein U0790_23785 [Isosphaeraceae bacterium]